MALTLLTGVLAFACGSGDDDSPATNPLAETPTPRSETRPPPPIRTPTSTPTQTPTAPATPSGPVAPPSAQELESAIGAAIDVMAEWLGVEAIDLSLADAEALVWPDSCLGAARPGQACAEVLTPGFRVQLLDRAGGAHTVHADTRGGFVWAGEVQVLATLQELDLAAGRALVEFDDGPAELVLVPGTLVEGSALRSGASNLDLAVVVSVDPPAAEDEPTLLAWIAPFVTP